MEEEENQTTIETPKRIPNPNGVVFFAKTNFRNQETKFGIKKDDRRRHMYLIGKTGMGKSTAMENMIIQDIYNGEGVCLVDPHGDFAEKILDFIPNDRINDVVYLNPADMEYPVAFNVMESVSYEQKHLVASGLIGVFKKLWADSWGPRLEYLLRNAILALLDFPGSTLLGVMRILVDKNYRQKVIEKIQDPVVKSFWVEEYSKYPQSFQVEAIAPIQNKVGQFLSNALIRNVIGQVKSTLDMRYIMDNRKILIMNLSKGRIGEDSSALLGAMMITKIQLAAMSRIDMLEPDRKDFYLYVDEFQNFATESFAAILSEARKYRLDLIIGHQYVEQLDEIVRAAVFGNVGTLMCFRVGAADAEFLATEFAPYFIEEDLVNLAKYDTYMKLMIDGVSSTPFSAKTLPPLGEEYYTGNAEKVIRVSRERYAKPKAVVEDKIARWTGVIIEAEEKQMEEFDKIKREQRFGPKKKKNSAGEKTAPTDTPKADSQKSEDKDTYTVDCYECGTPTEITFVPDGVRPVYCQTCFQKIREKLMHGQADDVKMAEVPTNNEPEISLTEALKKPPQMFEKKTSNPPGSQRPKDNQNNHSDKLSLEDLIAKKKAEDTQNYGSQRRAQPADDNRPKTIKPGQVIKF
ncbi:MAG: type IV secretion system DNA-binding domain-containing protein [Candidatus Buchananbacteria bacterium]